MPHCHVRLPRAWAPSGPNRDHDSWRSLRESFLLRIISQVYYTRGSTVTAGRPPPRADPLPPQGGVQPQGLPARLARNGRDALMGESTHDQCRLDPTGFPQRQSVQPLCEREIIRAGQAATAARRGAQQRTSTGAAATAAGRGSAGGVVFELFFCVAFKLCSKCVSVFVAIVCCIVFAMLFFSVS